MLVAFLISTINTCCSASLWSFWLNIQLPTWFLISHVLLVVGSQTCAKYFSRACFSDSVKLETAYWCSFLFKKNHTFNSVRWGSGQFPSCFGGRNSSHFPCPTELYGIFFQLSKNWKRWENVFGYYLSIWKYQISVWKFADTFIWLNVSKRVLTKLSFEKYCLRIWNPLLAFHPSIMANNNTVISMASGKSIKPFHIFNWHFVFLEKSIPATNNCRCDPIVSFSRDEFMERLSIWSFGRFW